MIGDAGDDLSYRNLDVAFRLIRGGAEFLAMHRNPWWLTDKGETLDAGAFVAGLEFSTGRPARVLGKPSPEVFRQAVAGLRADLGERLPAVQLRDGRRRPARRRRGGPARRAARGARPLGQDRAASDLATRPRRGRGPDGIADTLADVVAALD